MFYLGNKFRTWREEFTKFFSLTMIYVRLPSDYNRKKIKHQSIGKLIAWSGTTYRLLLENSIQRALSSITEIPGSETQYKMETWSRMVATDTRASWSKRDARVQLRSQFESRARITDLRVSFATITFPFDFVYLLSRRPVHKQLSL